MPHTGSQDVLAVLSSDHRSIELALTDPRLIVDDDEGLALRAQLVAELVRHLVAEEEYAYPLLHSLAGPAGLADELAQLRLGDREAELRLRAFEDPELTQGGVAMAVADVRKAFSAHCAAQEGQLFPLLSQQVEPDELARLGSEVLGAEQLAPTRPRHLAPREPALAKVTSLVEGYADRVRDHYSRRGVEPGRDGMAVD